MKKFIASAICFFLTFSSCLFAENYYDSESESDFTKTGATRYFSNMPINDFCEIWINWCDAIAKEHTDLYYQGYWQGQKDICIFILDKN